MKQVENKSDVFLGSAGCFHLFVKVVVLSFLSDESISRKLEQHKTVKTDWSAGSIGICCRDDDNSNVMENLKNNNISNNLKKPTMMHL